MRLTEPFYRAGEHVGIDLPGARVVFTTRLGGASSGPYATLNLGRFTDDDPASVEHNRHMLENRLGVRFAYGRQVHGARVKRVAEPPAGVAATGVPATGVGATGVGATGVGATGVGATGVGAVGVGATRVAAVGEADGQAIDEADGQATAVPGIAPLVLTADCLPVALAGDGAVAMLHAGWRGLQAGVIAAGVAALRELGARGALTAALGPAAGPCCYEVGDEVRAAFAGYGERGRCGRNLDLKAIARRQLEDAGVRAVHDVGLCTVCTPSLFYSHRRDGGVTGRQAGIAWLG